MEASDVKAIRDALVEATGVLEEILDAFKRGTGGVPMSNVKEVIERGNSALAKPPRNCDRFPNVDFAYERFRSYVARENPSCTKPSPLHTVWDALKWVLGDETKKEDV